MRHISRHSDGLHVCLTSHLHAFARQLEELSLSPKRSRHIFTHCLWSQNEKPVPVGGGEVGRVAGRKVENDVPKLTVASRVGGLNVVVVGSVPELRALAGTKIRLLVVVGTGTKGRALLMALKDLSATCDGGVVFMGKNGVGCLVVATGPGGRCAGEDGTMGKNGVGCLPVKTAFCAVPGWKASLGVGGSSCRIVGLRDGAGLGGNVGLCVTGLGVVGLCVVGLGVVGNGTVGLGVVCLGVVNLGIVGLSVVCLGVVNLTVVGLGVVGLGVVGLSIVGLCVVTLCVVGLCVVGL